MNPKERKDTFSKICFVLSTLKTLHSAHADTHYFGTAPRSFDSINSRVSTAPSVDSHLMLRMDRDSPVSSCSESENVVRLFSTNQNNECSNNTSHLIHRHMFAACASAHTLVFGIFNLVICNNNSSVFMTKRQKSHFNDFKSIY